MHTQASTLILGVILFAPFLFFALMAHIDPDKG